MAAAYPDPAPISSTRLPRLSDCSGGGGVEDVAEVVDALAGVLGEEAEVGDDELPFGVRDVAGVRSVSDHTLNYVGYCTKVHNTL